MEHSYKQRLKNYACSYSVGRGTGGSRRAGITNALFDLYADVWRASRRLADSAAPAPAGLPCPHGSTALIRRLPRRIVRCRQCGVAFAVDRDTVERAVERHDGDYFLAHKEFIYPDGKPDLFSYLMPRILFLWALGYPAFRPSFRRSLDVGCGTGIMVKYLEFLGFEAHGVEISEFAVDYGRRELGLKNVRRGTVQEAAFPDGHFSLVTVVHLLEHVEDPVPILREVFRLVAPGGYAYVEVPCSERDTSDYLIDDHFWFHTPQSLHRLLASIGFEDVRVGEGTFDRMLHNVPFLFAAAGKPIRDGAPDA